LRLVGPKGEPLGIVTLEDALRQAEAAGLDLVEIAPEADPPVAQLMDYNKMRCDRQKRERKARRAKREAGILVEPKTKEVKFRVKIAPHDYDVKVRHARAFLTQGHRVKLVITLRGREAEHQDLAAQLLERCVRDLSEVGAVEHRDLGEPKYKSVTMVSKKT
jgi:translation initiation factor IF-3